MIMGIGVRLALKMGYHRDPRHLTSITPFEGEMRRRTFFLVEIFDLLFAFQAGLPSIIHEEECDVEPPSNLFDTDFAEDCKELPPSRPPADPTPMLYFCYKSQMAKTLRRVIRHALSLKSSPYEDTIKLDRELKDQYKKVPLSLQMRPLSSSIIEPAVVIFQRYSIELMHLKSLCVLHRSFLSHGRLDPAYNYSRKTCLDAASQILTHQAELHAACQPGGLFFQDRWMLSNLALHDNSLLAAMVLCLHLFESRDELNSGNETSNQNVERYYALIACREIWLSRRSFSKEAARASHVLGIMLSRLPTPVPSLGSANAALDNSCGLSEPSKGDNMIWKGTTMREPSFHAMQPSVTSQNEADSIDADSRDPVFTLFGDSDEPDWVSVYKHYHHGR